MGTKIMFTRWNLFFKNNKNRNLFIIFFVILIIIGINSANFFNLIQQRNGIILNDYLLNILPVKDVSILIFLIIWGEVVYLLYKIIPNPNVLLQVLISYVLITLLRFLCIYLTPLSPPNNIIDLIDPIANTFIYPSTNAQIFNKDLFFSGHTATTILVLMVAKTRVEKFVLIFISIILIIALLVQHVHYTIDVLFAIVLPILVWKWVGYFLKN